MTGVNLTILVVEDGEEYLDNLSRFVQGPTYLQAHSGAEAIDLLKREPVDLLYLDMRFDRIPREDLLGDHFQVTREQNGDPERAWKYLMNHQGLYILSALKKEGFADLPVVLAYDFSEEERRFENLKRQYPNLVWVSDAVSFTEIEDLFRIRAKSANQAM
jgi:CheY-like chemotaxis protein